MALTLAQIQTMITNKEDSRQIINEIADHLQANPGGGGGGVNLESYQNSVMSAAVMAYVFRDESDNIYRVYEPIRNNDVSRKSYAYADSIDKFAFDSADNFNNRILDVKLITVPVATKFQNCELRTMIINWTNKTGGQLIGHNQIGNLGNQIVALGGHGEEIYVTGNNVVFDGNYAWHGKTGVNPTFFDDIGDDSLIQGSQFGVCCRIFGTNHKVLITDCDFKTFNTIRINESPFSFDLLDIVMEDASELVVNSATASCVSNHIGIASVVVINAGNVQKNKIGINCDIQLGHNTNQCEFSGSTVYASAGAKSDANFINIAGTTYEMGESTGTATLTAV